MTLRVTSEGAGGEVPLTHDLLHLDQLVIHRNETLRPSTEFRSVKALSGADCMVPLGFA